MSAFSFVVTIALKKDSDFSPFDPNRYSLDAYDEQHSMVVEAEYLSTLEKVNEFLEFTFESGNVGALRPRLTRSLSVGDVVKIEHLPTGRVLLNVIEPVGWTSYVHA